MRRSRIIVFSMLLAGITLVFLEAALQSAGFRNRWSSPLDSRLSLEAVTRYLDQIPDQCDLLMVCIGESTMAGEPFAPLGIPLFLEFLLRRQNPEDRIVVLNLGTPGEAAQYYTQIGQLAASYDPDLVIMYGAHNEHVSLNAELALLNTPQSFREVLLAVAYRSVLISLVDRAVMLLRVPRGEAGANLAEITVAPDPAIQERLKRHWFDRYGRLHSILGMLYGIPLVAIEPVCNLTLPPYEATLDEERWLLRLSRGGELGAVDHQSVQEYALALVAERAGNAAEAKHHYQAAANLDAMTLRSPPNWGEGLRTLAQNQRNLVFPVSEVFADSTKEGMLRPDAFSDSIHFSLQGYYLASVKLASFLKSRDQLRELTWDEAAAPDLNTALAELGVSPISIWYDLTWETLAWTFHHESFQPNAALSHAILYAPIPLWAERARQALERDANGFSHDEAATLREAIAMSETLGREVGRIQDLFPLLKRLKGPVGALSRRVVEKGGFSRALVDG